ncbi:MAG: tyrosine-type recombinase/integrase [Alphaproteobacteria bacterium]|nr:tyrosine-type recombinase/integrase [Alphaproteobacteria bacterium]
MGTPEFFAELAAAEATLKPRPTGKPGSLALVIAEYKTSTEFQDLRPNTRSEYDRILNLLAPLGGPPMVEVKSADIVRIRDNLVKRRNRSAANKAMAMLSILFSYAVERGYADSNPVKGVKKVRRKSGSDRKNRPWTKAELDTVIAQAPEHIALPLRIGRWTGLRESDVLDLRVGEFEENVIRRKTLKRGVWVTLPVAEPLKIAIESRPVSAAATICTNSRGATWTTDGFKTSLFKLIQKLENNGAIAKGLTFHGLRHTVATELRELGFDTRTIADMLGQRSESMAMHYSQGADLQEKLKPAIEKMEIAEKTRTQLSRKAGKSV